ncbi:WecB/TagA/CpsF family glycosyltransferase [Planctomycetes bacterium K23_9]|uniref:N-acetylmannosaminyltransferase n=1 Tax=Stieleria marina TaxID=1930275 RepID=A0A517NRK4_9BACT|nr:Putative N-acetylmannosaminyltransferase [Planctomycetes bacterium K23_9]
MPVKSSKVNILGVAVDAINMGVAIEKIDQWIQSGASQYVCVTPVHSVMECQDDDDLRDIFNQAGMVTPDGMPVVWICNWFGFKDARRVYGPDLMLTLCDHSQKPGYRHFFYGGAEGVAPTLSENLQKRFPDMKSVGTLSPPYKALSESENRAMVDTINAANPDIVWVGLGSPKQERWMAKNIDVLNASVVIGVGAAFDFHVGRVRQAPAWMQRSGMEWFFRLIMEPRRLWRRYLIGNSRFVVKFFMQVTGLKSYAIATPRLN